MRFSEMLMQPVGHAIGWTLLHFLWQGCVVAALLAVARTLLKGRSSNLRYLAACSALILMVVFPAATFWKISDSLRWAEVDETSLPAQRREDVKPSIGSIDAVPERLAGGASKAELLPRRHLLGEQVESLLPWLTLLWVAGVFVLTARMLGGLMYAQRLKRYAIPVAGHWHEKLRELSGALRVTRPVRLLESTLVQVPTAIGCLRPVILLPASALTGLTLRQLEVILAHELAHIRRHDYIFNLLQTITETLLFYHPAVWWVSRQVRIEREHACDDMAVAVCGDALLYARALTRVERLRKSPPPQLTVAADGGNLRGRILRLVENSQPSRRASSLLVGLVILVAFVMTLAGARIALSQKPRLAARTNEQTRAGSRSDAPKSSESATPLHKDVASLIALDDMEGEDMEVRRAALDALGGRAGTIVVMDARDGRIYTIVNQEWALRRGWTPASTMKLVTGLAGIGEKIIDPALKVKVTDRPERLNFTDALALSNNPYFRALGERVGAERIINYARQLGLGELTGINYAGESSGRLPTPRAGVNAGRLGAYGEGVEVTPIQLATLVAAVANGGKLFVPRVPRAEQNANQTPPEVRGQLNIPRDVLDQLVNGMIASVERGTGNGAKNARVQVAGKTGSISAQEMSTGIFASYAPIADPHWVVVVLTRGQEENGSAAAGIAGMIYQSLGNRP